MIGSSMLASAGSARSLATNASSLSRTNSNPAINLGSDGYRGSITAVSTSWFALGLSETKTFESISLL